MTTRPAATRRPTAVRGPLPNRRLSRLLSGLLCPLLAGLLSGPAAAANDGFKLDQEHPRPRGGLTDEPIDRPQVAAPVPPWPRDGDLIAFVPDGPERPFKFFIDGRSLSLSDRDSEVHFTLVIESRTGTRNVSFEGLRCTLHGAWKTFAYGADGRFVKAEGTDWESIPETGNDAYREDLRLRFCVPREFRARPIKDLQRALRGRVSRSDNTGFQAQ